MNDTSSRIERPQGVCSQTGTDPLDDFVDGVDLKKASSKGIPLCQGHQQPCRLRTVRKATSAHKGRKFYVCAMERRHEQCNHFQWADNDGDTAAVTQEDSTTGFVQRQVQAFLKNLQPLTVPELRTWAAARNLSTQGKRGQVWTRIALYVRDEIASALPASLGEDPAASEANGTKTENTPNDNDSESDSELEFDVQPPGTKHTAEMSEETNSQQPEDSRETQTRSIHSTRTNVALDLAKKRNSILLEESEDSEEELEISRPTSGTAKSQGSDMDCEVDQESDSSDDEELEIVPPQKPGKKELNTANACPLRDRLQTLFGHNDFRPGQE